MTTDMGKVAGPMLMGIGGIMVAGLVYNWITSQVSGVAHDNHGNGVEGVTVTLNSASMVTGADGAYSFQTAPGSRVISFSKSGYYPVSRIIELAAGTETVYNVPMVETIIDPTGTVLCLPMSEGAGLYVMDVSGYGNDGLLGGGVVEEAPTWGTLPDGRRYLSFDGGDYINCGAGVSLDIPGTPAISVRVLMDDKTTEQVIVSKGHTLGANSNYSLTIYRGRLYFEVWSGGVRKNVSYSIASLSTGILYHFLALYDGTHLRIYVNGVEVASSNIGALALDTNTLNLTVGAAQTAHKINGFIDELRIYDKVISGADAIALSA